MAAVCLDTVRLEPVDDVINLATKLSVVICLTGELRGGGVGGKGGVTGGGTSWSCTKDLAFNVRYLLEQFMYSEEASGVALRRNCTVVLLIAVIIS